MNSRAIGSTWLALCLSVMSFCAEAQPDSDKLLQWLKRDENRMSCAIDKIRFRDRFQRAEACRAIQQLRYGGRACIHIDLDTERTCKDVAGGKVRRPWLVQPPSSIIVAQPRLIVRSLGTSQAMLLLKVADRGQCNDGAVAADLSVFVLLKPNDPPRTGTTFQCSMVQVADALFLTAKHCVVGLDHEYLALAGPDADSPVSELHCTSPEPAAGPARVNDVAVCRIPDQANTSFKEVALTDWSALAGLASKDVVLASAGEDEHMDKGTVIYGSANFLDVPLKPDPPNWPTQGLDDYNGGVEAVTTCQAFAQSGSGDSGAPVFDQSGNGRRLLGVISSAIGQHTYFTPFAKKRICDFLSDQHALPNGTDCKQSGP